MSLESIQDKLRAQQYNLEILQLYAWYESQGIVNPWETIKGLRKERNQKLGILFHDGSTRIIDYPPFTDNVIFNRGLNND